MQHTRAFNRNGYQYALLCLAPGRVCPSTCITARDRALLPHVFTLTIPTQLAVEQLNGAMAVIFCGTFHGFSPPSVEPKLFEGTFPLGVRTFLLQAQSLKAIASFTLRL